MTFSGKICFPSKVPEFLHVLFDEVVKHSPCTLYFFWLVCTLFLKKMKTKYRSVHNERNKAEQEHLSPKKDTRKQTLAKVAPQRFGVTLTLLSHLGNKHLQSSVDFRGSYKLKKVYPGPRGFLLFFFGKFCDANRFLNFFFIDTKR